MFLENHPKCSYLLVSIDTKFIRIAISVNHKCCFSRAPFLMRVWVKEMNRPNLDPMRKHKSLSFQRSTFLSSSCTSLSELPFLGWFSVINVICCHSIPVSFPQCSLGQLSGTRQWWPQNKRRIPRRCCWSQRQWIPKGEKGWCDATNRIFARPSPHVQRKLLNQLCLVVQFHFYH